ncbi:MAG: response regulator [Verrucomicrobia bacterium]|nr:response regulator [Verrucomicrobiota bacterium]
MRNSRNPVDAEVERSRLAVLRAYGVLATGREPEFDELVQHAVRECGYETALLAFMDADRCWLKAAAGPVSGDPAVTEMPRHETFCAYAQASSELLVVPDATADARFRDLPIVRRPDGYRAYAGAQLITPEGYSIGSLCVLDRHPRQPTAEQLAALRRHAIDAMALLELRRLRDNAPAPSVIVPVAAQAARRGVLVADDEIVVRQFLEYVLRESLVPAFSAEDGAAALKLFRRHSADIGLVLTDLNMPVMDGFRLIAELKGETNPPTVAVMSGRLDPLMRAQLTGMGVSRILAKPFALDDVKKVIALVSA